jgi:hypothetical protein
LGVSDNLSVTLGSSVTSIGNGAFGSNLFSVTFQGTIPSSGFDINAYTYGDLRDKFYTTDKTNGTPGTYKRTGGDRWTSFVWTKQ